MSTADTAGPRRDARLIHFPVPIFGMTMGILGLALAFQAAGYDRATFVAGGVGTVVLAGLLGLYLLKALRHPAAVAAEWHHPVRLAFFPTITISLLLLAMLLVGPAPRLAEAIWALAALAQGVLTIVVFSVWMSHRAFGPAQLSPAWFIPAVGNAIVPVGGVAFGHIEVSWYFFSIGVLFWVVLLTLVFNRLIFHDPLPGKLRPTLVILVAPPSVSFLGWTALNGGVIDAPAHMLINLGFFFTALVAVQVPRLLRLPFALSFWALSFPLAAMTVSSLRFADLSGSAFHRGAGMVLLGALVLAITGLGLRTLKAAFADEICQPEQ